MARVERAPGRPPALTLFESQPWTDEGAERRHTLEAVARRHDLDRARCTTVLDGREYSLLVTEAPDVPAEELRAALRWRIKDLIDFHINDATLDVFELPGEKAPGRARPMYVVAARTAAIQQRVDEMEAAGMGLDIIDIPELAQRNLAALLPEDARGVVMICFAADHGLLTITRQGELYLSRSLDLGLERLAGAGGTAHFERIVLEVQRSLDYYESHFRQAPITSVALAPAGDELRPFAGHLQDSLTVAIRLYELTEVLDCRVAVPARFTACQLLTVGAALREEQLAL